ncbi:MAG: ATP-binding cassette domain-containing protein [Clostridia bacterium]|nr:ATP-binding cassette domain-containing protein [Clostridia bacterium]
MSKNIIEVCGLVKKFESIIAVNKAGFNVEEGEIFGFLGPNGAGKSTTIKLLCTILKQNEGSVHINGYNTLSQPHRVRESVGIIFQDPSLDNNLTVVENLYFHAKLYHVPGRLIKERIEEALELVDMSERGNSLVRTLSGGMKRRVEIARGMLHAPRLLFLDEPTIGLDPQTRKQVWEYIGELRTKKGMTMFLTTHYMEEAEICSRIAIMDQGRIIALDTPGNLKRMVGGDVVTIKTGNPSGIKSQLDVNPGLQCEIIDNETIRIILSDSGKSIPTLFEKFGDEIREIDVKKTTLEDVFIKLTGRKIREEEGNAHRDRTKNFMKMRKEA